MKLSSLFLLTVLLLGGVRRRAMAQATAPALTLTEVIAQALDHSAAGQQTITNRETSYWTWRAYQANYRPQLGVLGTLPNFSRVITPVVQPDGTTDFRAVRINNSNLALTLSQNVGM